MIFSNIKNKTLFDGEVKLKFKFLKNKTKLEIYFLNEVHFKLFGIEIFSYIIPKIENGECLINEEKKAQIEKSCNIILKKIDSNIKNFGNKNAKLNYYSFTKTGIMVGNHKLALRFLENNLRLDNEYPDKIFEKYVDKKLVGYGCINDIDNYFTIGDKIYDKNYIVSRKDFTNKEYSEIKSNIQSCENMEKTFKNSKEIEYVLNEFSPKKKGKKIISKISEAKISALNYAKKII